MSDEQQRYIPTPPGKRVLIFRFICYVVFVALSAWQVVSHGSDWTSWVIAGVEWILVGYLGLRFGSAPR
jgi:hypothetical protein